jgi:uncharacterized membrane protein YvlD (DUF360 family)
MKLIFGWVAITLTVIVVIALLPGLSVDWSAGVYSAIAASFAVLNVLLGWILTPLSVPFTALAWGSIAFVVNTVALLITDTVMGSLHVDGIVPALIAAAIIAGVDLVIEGVSRSVRTSEARAGW